MESEVLSEEMQWEARRVVAAFEVDGWDGDVLGHGFVNLMGTTRQGLRCLAQFLLEPCARRQSLWWRFGLHDWGTSVCVVEWQAEPRFRWDVVRQTGHQEWMMRALYRLGFDEGVLARLNHPLSAHEKLELRLAMPREFWPRTWLDEGMEDK